MKREYWNAVIIGLFCLSVVLGVAILVRRGETLATHPRLGAVPLVSAPRFALVDVSGPIYYNDAGDRWLVRDARHIVRKLKQYAEDSSIKGILLRINSPGGTVGAVQELHAQLMKLRDEKTGKPVVCFVPELCASGGYYLASAADRIVCTPGAILGSIGVIMQTGDFSALMKKIGVKVVVVKSARFKDIGSPWREMDPEERRILEDIVMTAYDQFVDAVAAGRDMTPEQVRAFADGRIVPAPRAVDLKMADQLGSEDDAVEALKNLAGITGNVEWVRDTDFRDYLRSLVGEFRAPVSPVERMMRTGFRVAYLME